MLDLLSRLLLRRSFTPIFVPKQSCCGHFVFQLLVGFVKRHFGEHTRSETAIGIELYPFRRNDAGRLPDTIGNRVCAFDLRETAIHAAETDRVVLRELVENSHVAGDRDMVELLDTRIADYYAEDRECPLGYEPSGHDFLSPCLGEADLMRRVRRTAGFADWLRELLPGIPEGGDPAGWLEPAVVSDASDGKLVHLDGLNLSRAWMLQGIAEALPAADPRRAALVVAAREHREVGLAAVTGEYYEGGHWLATFATYLITERGLR